MFNYPGSFSTIITTKGFFLKDYLVPQSNGAEVQKFKRAKDWKCLTVYKFAAEKTRGQGLKVENREWSRTISSFDPKLFDGTLASQLVYPSGGGYQLIVADVNGDGRPDVVKEDYYGNKLTVNLNRCLP